MYVWADGVHFNVRLEDDGLCTLVVIGARADGQKELIAVEDGYHAGSRAKSLIMAFKLVMLAQESWCELNGVHLLPLVRAGIRFVEGVQIECSADEEDRKEAA